MANQGSLRLAARSNFAQSRLQPNRYASSALRYPLLICVLHEILTAVCRLESYVSQTKRAPLILLVVQGGPGTVSTMVATAESGEPLIILSDSGGAASAFHQYVSTGQLTEEFQKKFGGQIPKFERLKTLNDEVGGALLSFFELESGDDLSKAMLTAILKMTRARRSFTRPARTSPASFQPKEASSDPASAGTIELAGLKTEHHDEELETRLLCLAVKWDRPAILQELLSQSSAPKDEEIETASPAKLALQLALELGRTSIVELLMELGEAKAMCKHLKMSRLFKVAARGDFDGHHYCTDNKALNTFLREHEGKLQNLHMSTQDKHALYAEFAVPFYHKISWMLSDMVRVHADPCVQTGLRVRPDCCTLPAFRPCAVGLPPLPPRCASPSVPWRRPWP